MNDERITMIVADDNDDMREMTAEFLTAFGFEVKTGASVAAALALIDADVDAVMTDVRFGDGEAGGLELCRELRATHPHVRVFVVSGDASVESAALQAGAEAFWLKPVDLNEVVAALQR